MNVDEFRKLRPVKTAKEPTPELRGVAQEAVRLEALTHDENWDYFLRYIEAAVKAAKRHKQVMIDRLCDPMQTNPDESAKAKAMIAVTGSRIETLEEILLLPKFLKEQGQKAVDKIVDMERSSA